MVPLPLLSKSKTGLTRRQIERNVRFDINNLEKRGANEREKEANKKKSEIRDKEIKVNKIKEARIKEKISLR